MSESPIGSSRKSEKSYSTFESSGLSDDDLYAVDLQVMREKSVSVFGLSPPRFTLVFVIAFAFISGGLYLNRYSGGFEPLIYDETLTLEAFEVQGIWVFDPYEVGKKLYKRNCQDCHTPTGTGIPGSYPQLVESEWVLGSEDRLTKVLLNGLSGPITVNGKEFKGQMPAFKQHSDRELAAIMTYIRTNSEWGHRGEAVAEEIVIKIRAEYGEREIFWSVEELLEMHPLK